MASTAATPDWTFQRNGYHEYVISGPNGYKLTIHGLNEGDPELWPYKLESVDRFINDIRDDKESSCRFCFYQHNVHADFLYKTQGHTDPNTVDLKMHLCGSMQITAELPRELVLDIMEDSHEILSEFVRDYPPEKCSEEDW